MTYVVWYVNIWQNSIYLDKLLINASRNMFIGYKLGRVTVMY